MNLQKQHAEPANRTTVAALIPAFCEEKQIAYVVARTRRQLDYVLVIDDGSSDDTAAQARKAGADLIVHEQNRGKGAAIKTGLHRLLQQNFSYVLVLDADGQHAPEEIPRFLDLVNREHANLVVGSRMADSRRMPIVRRVTNKFMSALISALCRQRIPDTQCGFRLVHRDLASELLGGANNYDYET